MNRTVPLVAILAAACALVLAVAPAAMAELGGSDNYHKHWAVPIGNATGTLQITDDVDREALKEQAISMDEALEGYEDVKRARLVQAVNDSGEYYLAWKLRSVSYDGESDTRMYTMHILDAGTGDLLATMEGGGCGGSSHKSGSG